MTERVQYEIFVICPDCGYRKHYFTDQQNLGVDIGVVVIRHSLP